jgi:4-amino-4-deoxy-L-arabinose transferase-like glycosyltransferase
MPLASDQLRLLWAAALCALPLVAGYRLARRSGAGAWGWIDAILVAYLIQYFSVGVPGVLGFLTPLWVTLVCVVLCAIVWWVASAGSQSAADAGSTAEKRWVLGALLGAIGFIGAFIFTLRFEPPMATDTLVYHLPAAVFWLQQHQMGLFQTWFFNPANTFSPLAGSMFAAYLIGPMGNDSLARFMQLGVWVLIFLAVMKLARSAGASSGAVALAGLAAAVSRPFVSQAVLVKDDLFVTAFFLVAVLAVTDQRSNKTIAALRAGVAVGLMLAMKFTAMMTLPMLLLAVDAPFRERWRWKEWGLAILSVAVIAGPWYLRNWVCFGNPVFPVCVHFLGFALPGIFSSVRVEALRTVGGTWEVLTGGYFALPAVLFVFLAVMWVGALIRSWKLLLRDPLRRVIVLGPLVGIATYLIFSPQAEVRFLFPAFVLMFVAAAIALPGGRGAGACAVIATISVCTSFVPEQARQIVTFAISGAILAIVGIFVYWAQTDYLRFRKPWIAGVCAVALFLVLVFRWDSYIYKYRQGRFDYWDAVYPTHAAAWRFVDQQVPDAATLAYSNQFMIYPLHGFDGRRRVLYAPVRSGASVSGLAFPDRVTDSEISNDATSAANAPADHGQWLANLRASGAEYLLVGVERDSEQPGPEVAWADGDPAQFTKIFANEEAAVYRIHLKV